jgi:hypothetical protein
VTPASDIDRFRRLGCRESLSRISGTALEFSIAGRCTPAPVPKSLRQFHTPLDLNSVWTVRRLSLESLAKTRFEDDFPDSALHPTKNDLIFAFPALRIRPRSNYSAFCLSSGIGVCSH